MTTIRIGTRGSALALAQTDLVVSALKKRAESLNISLSMTVHPIKTTGDQVTDRPLCDLGGKSLFTREIDRALLNGEIDIAVHSMKDVETCLPHGIDLIGFLPREDPRDVLVSLKKWSIADLPEGALIGTCAPRRVCFLKQSRPDLIFMPLRGNVTTRLQSLTAGLNPTPDAIVLAAAGLRRLNYVLSDVGVPLSIGECVPAAGQGIVGVAMRAGDFLAAHPVMACLSHERTGKALRLERLFLTGLKGDCFTPVGCYAAVDGTGIFSFTATVFRGDVARSWDLSGPYDHIERAVKDAGKTAGKWYHGFVGICSL